MVVKKILPLKQKAFKVVSFLIILIFFFSDSVFPLSYKKRRESIRRATYQIESLNKSLNKIARDYSRTYDKYLELSVDLRQIEAELKEEERKVQLYQNSLLKRVRSLYQDGGVNFLEVLLKSKDFNDFLIQLDYARRIAAQDAHFYVVALNLKRELEKKKIAYQKAKVRYKYQVKLLKKKQRTMEKKLKWAKALLEKLKASGYLVCYHRRRKIPSRFWQGFRIGDFVFPVAGAHATADSYGAPRRGHRHQGNDIFALKGTPLVATTDGVVRTSQGGSGGIMLYLHGDDGNTYFYAHLSCYSSNIYSGARVRAGQIVGYVGNTGNARGGAPHLHFEIHPGGGHSIDPYPILRSAE